MEQRGDGHICNQEYGHVDSCKTSTDNGLGKSCLFSTAQEYTTHTLSITRRVPETEDTRSSPHHDHTPQSNFPGYPLMFALTHTLLPLSCPCPPTWSCICISPRPAKPARTSRHSHSNADLHDTMHVKLSIKLSMHTCNVIVPAFPTTPSRHLSRTTILTTRQSHLTRLHKVELYPPSGRGTCNGRC